MNLMLCKRRVRWLGHVRRMENGRISKDLLYGENAAGRRQAGRPTLRFRDVCKRDLKLTGIDKGNWEALRCGTLSCLLSHSKRCSQHLQHD